MIYGVRGEPFELERTDMAVEPKVATCLCHLFLSLCIYNYFSARSPSGLISSPASRALCGAYQGLCNKPYFLNRIKSLAWARPRQALPDLLISDMACCSQQASCCSILEA